MAGGLADKPRSAQADKPAPLPDNRFAQVAEGAKRYRDTAKWLISGFAALGAALAGTLSIASVAGASLVHNWYAVAGFAVVMSGCILAMAAATYTLASSRLSSRDLMEDDPGPKTRRLKAYAVQERQFYLGFDSLKDLFTTHEKALEDRNRAFLRGDSAGETKASRTLELTRPLVTNVLTYTTFEQLRRRFLISVAGVMVGVAATAAGAFIFAAGVPEDEASEALADNPVYAQLSVNASAHDRYAEALGPSCDLSQLLVVVLSADADSYEVLASSTNDSCPLALMSVGRDEASIEPCSSSLADLDDQFPPSTSPSPSNSPSLERSLKERSACDFDDPPDIVIIRGESPRRDASREHEQALRLRVK